MYYELGREGEIDLIEFMHEESFLAPPLNWIAPAKYIKLPRQVCLSGFGWRIWVLKWLVYAFYSRPGYVLKHFVLLPTYTGQKRFAPSGLKVIQTLTDPNLKFIVW